MCGQDAKEFDGKWLVADREVLAVLMPAAAAAAAAWRVFNSAY